MGCCIRVLGARAMGYQGSEVLGYQGTREKKGQAAGLLGCWGTMVSVYQVVGVL